MDPNSLILFLSALAMVESGMNPDAIGNAGEKGVLQIQKICVDDINRILTYEEYKYDDRLSIFKSVEMFIIYTFYYAPCPDNFEQLARIWNGGPDGYRKESTVEYYNKVKEKAKSIKPDKFIEDAVLNSDIVQRLLNAAY